MKIRMKFGSALVMLLDRCSRTKFLSNIGLSRGCFALLLLIAAAGVSAPSAMATILPLAACPPLAPGTTGVPCDATGQPAGTLLASLSAPFTTFTGTDSGTLLSAVYREAAGTLDFYYQIHLDTTSTNCGNAGQSACDNLSRETDTNFSNGGLVVTQVAFRTDAVPPFVGGPTVPGVFILIPTSVDRSTSGNVVGFSFNSPDFTPGSTSPTLVISTNATTFTSGNASVSDGSGATVASFEPGPAAPITTPEPASLLLLGTGLLGLARAVRRKVA